MIKFTGLILICAASSLALVLPALGMVKFPMVQGISRVTEPASAAIPPSAAILQGLSATNSASPAATPQAIPQGMLTGTNLPGNPNAGIPTAGNPPAASDSGPSLFGPPWTKQKVGLNVWLLLGPVLLIGLMMWTFAPNRSGSGR